MGPTKADFCAEGLHSLCTLQITGSLLPLHTTPKKVAPEQQILWGIRAVASGWEGGGVVGKPMSKGGIGKRVHAWIVVKFWIPV